MARKKRTRKTTLDAARLTPSECAALLTGTGVVVVTEEEVLTMVSRGAPSNEDGTVGIVQLTAWLVRERESRRRAAR